MTNPPDSAIVAELKTSAEWQEARPSIKVVDPDGWDAQQFYYSWFVEPITEREYAKRLCRSTVSGLHPYLERGYKLLP